mmetsp:Transcript_42602/g.127758  ORF Transcript_42602/g.127758 Transcript_42602/m.127758 type:complete len:255 (-) Transcript_42602:2123-2887(-)
MRRCPPQPRALPFATLCHRPLVPKAVLSHRTRQWHESVGSSSSHCCGCPRVLLMCWERPQPSWHAPTQGPHGCGARQLRLLGRGLRERWPWLATQHLLMADCGAICPRRQSAWYPHRGRRRSHDVRSDSCQLKPVQRRCVADPSWVGLGPHLGCSQDETQEQAAHTRHQVVAHCCQCRQPAVHHSGADHLRGGVHCLAWNAPARRLAHQNQCLRAALHQHRHPSTVRLPQWLTPCHHASRLQTCHPLQTILACQ